MACEVIRNADGFTPDQRDLLKKGIVGIMRVTTDVDLVNKLVREFQKKLEKFDAGRMESGFEKEGDTRITGYMMGHVPFYSLLRKVVGWAA